jgi:hypothetical protein
MLPSSAQQLTLSIRLPAHPAAPRFCRRPAGHLRRGHATEAQFGRKLKDALKQNAENKAVQKAVEKEEKAIDAPRPAAPIRPGPTPTKPTPRRRG